jgi:hypothetical protein
MGEKSQWKWLWIWSGLSYSILTQEGSGGLPGEAGLSWVGRAAPLGTCGPRWTAAKLWLVVVLVTEVCVWEWEEQRWGLEGPWLPLMKKEDEGRVLVELGG